MNIGNFFPGFQSRPLDPKYFCMEATGTPLQRVGFPGAMHGLTMQTSSFHGELAWIWYLQELGEVPPWNNELNCHSLPQCQCRCTQQKINKKHQSQWLFDQYDLLMYFTYKSQRPLHAYNAGFLNWTMDSKASDTSYIIRNKCCTMFTSSGNNQGRCYLYARHGSIPWLLMPWLLASPGHQQSWSWQCRIDASSSRKDFNYQHNLSVKKILNMETFFHVPVQEILFANTPFTVKNYQYAYASFYHSHLPYGK